MNEYLSPGRFIDSNSPEVAAFAREVTAGASSELDKVQRLYGAVRDGITYDPYVNFADPVNYRASGVLAARRGFCVGKAALLAAGRWVKATPAFDAALCARVGIAPLAFDGQTDSLFQPFDRAGRRHMEYLKDRGAFADVPFDTMVADFRATYPTLISQK